MLAEMWVEGSQAGWVGPGEHLQVLVGCGLKTSNPIGFHRVDHVAAG